MTFRKLTIFAILIALLYVDVQAKDDVEGQVRAIASELRCVVCQNLSVADSPSTMAVQMRDVVRHQVKAGRTPDEIRAYFVSKYGEWVLLAPPTRGFNLIIWILPFVVLLAGIAAAVRLLLRWSKDLKNEAETTPDPNLLERVRVEAAGIDSTYDRPQDAPKDAQLIQLYRDLQELTFDHQAGKISIADYENLKQRYERQAVRRLQELPTSVGPAPTIPVMKTTGTKVKRRTSTWAVGAVLLLAGGVTLGLLLGQSLRPRISTEDSITGDFLTGTGPGGVGRPGLSDRLVVAQRQGQEAYQQKDFKTAIQSFRAVLNENPNHPLANAYMGMLMAQAGHTTAALEALDRALLQTPNLPLALWAKGMLLHRERRDPDAARQYLHRLAQLLPAGEQRDAVRQIIQSINRSHEESPETPMKASITGTVELRAGNTPESSKLATLYIVARAAGVSHTPPLAVKRVVAPTFPVSFSLSSSDVMMPDVAFEGPLDLSARLDRDGDPLTRESGELAGVHENNPVQVGARDITIRLE